MRQMGLNEFRSIPTQSPALAQDVKGCWCWASGLHRCRSRNIFRGYPVHQTAAWIVPPPTTAGILGIVHRRPLRTRHWKTASASKHEYNPLSRWIRFAEPYIRRKTIRPHGKTRRSRFAAAEQGNSSHRIQAHYALPNELLICSLREQSVNGIGTAGPFQDPKPKIRTPDSYGHRPKIWKSWMLSCSALEQNSQLWFSIQ